ncbi:hypothetical protein [uncultured Abyssibacter sp.]|uniref:hypothetical protein n=1 Tax=uncultured Abyssibacter sp. TaxID=2320202 RepID=UPI0032B1469C|tara:strand:+ start:239 stop:595 length:357 start_codon:yes stop_codon:yes gene_type:complete
MTTKAKAQSYPEEPWESGELGRSLEHAELASDDESGADEVDSALQLVPISIRLERSLIDAFKYIASHNKGIGYQPLMRQVLKRFATGEIKKIAAELEAVEREERKADAPHSQVDKVAS